MIQKNQNQKLKLKDLISNEDTWSIINNYFSLGEVQLVKHQISSYNDFIDNHISKIIKSHQYNPMIVDTEIPLEDDDNKLSDKVKYLRHEIRFENIYLHKPIIKKQMVQLHQFYLMKLDYEV